MSIFHKFTNDNIFAVRKLCRNYHILRVKEASYGTVSLTMCLPMDNVVFIFICVSKM